MPEETWEQQVPEAAAKGMTLVKRTELIHMDAPCGICKTDYP